MESNEIDRKHPGFNKNAKPFFDIIMEGLKDLIFLFCNFIQHWL